jgi:hypothetical protein
MRAPWAGSFSFQGLVDPRSDAESVTATLEIESDGRFQYTTHTFDVGSGMRLCCKRGVLARPGGGSGDCCNEGNIQGPSKEHSGNLRETFEEHEGDVHDARRCFWVLKVVSTWWRESSWNGEGEGSSDDVELISLKFTDAEKISVDGRVLERPTEIQSKL